MNNKQNPDVREKDPWALEKGLSSAPQKGSSASDQKVEKNTGDEPVASAVDKKKVPQPENIFEFVRQFYTAKTIISDQYKGSFKELDGNLSGDQRADLRRLAAESDPDFGRTLSLAEFVLESTVRPNQLDQVMIFVQCIVSNAGSLSITESNVVFQEWLDGNSALSDKLEFFRGKIEQITDGKDKKGSLKRLSGKRKNNLVSIAAMWLYYKQETSISQLIGYLLGAGMSLNGQTGPQVDNRAFAFAASMIKSTNKKKFSYFLDYVKRNENLLQQQYLSESARADGLARQASQLASDLQSSAEDVDNLRRESEKLLSEVAGLEAEKFSLLEQLQHTSIHHGAEKDSERSGFDSTLKDLLKTVELAQTALEEGHDKALKHQLKQMGKTLSKEIK